MYGIKWVLAAGCVGLALTGMAEESLGEDPFALNQAEHHSAGERPWEGKTPEEVRVWARKNLHHKLRAKQVIDEGDRPEWAWFRESGLGLFLHWGLTSENPDTGDAWAMVWSEGKERANRYMVGSEAMFAVADTWNPERYDPDKWLAAAKKAGFGYSVLTTRHHDGYCLWPSECGTWDTGEKMEGRDLVKDYVNASRKNDLKIGFYYSGPNWHYNYKTREFMWPPAKEFSVNYQLEKVEKDPALTPLMHPSGPEEREETKGQVRELLTTYGHIDMLWWDGTIPMSDEELAEIQPTIFVARGNIATPEGEHQSSSEQVKVMNEANWWWESCRKAENTFTPNWHYGIECENNHWDTNKLLTELVRCRSLGGNLLVNIPPRGDGSMMKWYYDLCDEMAGWMKHSREAVYDVDLYAPLPTLDKTQNYTTVRGDTYYSLPDENGVIFISNVRKPKSVTLLRTGEALNYEFRDGALRMAVPTKLQTNLPDMVKIVFNKKDALSVSDGSLFVPKKCYPKFSWDTTPMYYMFGETKRVLHPEEVEFISQRTDFICIEKSHGLNELGAAELGARHEVAAFKKLKPEMKVLFYYNSAYAWPFTSYNKMFRHRMIDDYPELKKLLITNPETGELEHRNNVFFFDVLNPDLRRWWVDTVAKGMSESGSDGVFIDQMHGFAWLRKDRSAEVEKAMGEMLGALKEKIGPDKILLANNAHQSLAKHVFPVMDASMFEHYNSNLLSKEKVLQDWDDMLRIAKAGKMSIFRIGVEAEKDKKESNRQRAQLATERLEYYQACYLIGAQPYSYFQYGWGWKLADGSLHDFPELQRPLGEPKGAYTRITPDGWEFTREFEHASVWVDTEKKVGKVTWK
ncbi:alpha-L-fucosidase [Pontiellaceae bacterium B1224]|nr:alpha-L-fucosidase [Pontiellaceae bacterium B1224]